MTHGQAQTVIVHQSVYPCPELGSCTNTQVHVWQRAPDVHLFQLQLQTLYLQIKAQKNYVLSATTVL